MNHDKEYVIHLNGFDLGQLIGGLEVRANAWRYTAAYFETGKTPDGFIIEECNGADEARQIEAHYRRIIRQLMEQRTARSPA